MFFCHLHHVRAFGLITGCLLFQRSSPLSGMAGTFCRLLAGRTTAALFAAAGTGVLTTGYLLNQQNLKAAVQEKRKLFPPRWALWARCHVGRHAGEVLVQPPGLCVQGTVMTWQTAPFAGHPILGSTNSGSQDQKAGVCDSINTQKNPNNGKPK